MSIGQKHIDFDLFPYETWVKTIKFKVLDINVEKKLVAFKHIYELQTEYYYDSDEEVIKKPVNCKYAGMEKYPKAGVVLGIYDLEKGEYLKTFTIYESCFTLKDCYDHELSAKKLDSAKQLFKDYSLEITKNPKALLFSKEGKKTYRLNVNGIKFSSSYKNDYDKQHTISYLYAGEKLLYSSVYEHGFIMGSTGEVFYKAAYKVGDKIIFLNKYLHTNNMGGAESFEYHYFSPVFLIKGDEVITDKR